jgi:hypothetical protein
VADDIASTTKRYTKDGEVPCVDLFHIPIYCFRTVNQGIGHVRSYEFLIKIMICSGISMTGYQHIQHTLPFIVDS